MRRSFAVLAVLAVLSSSAALLACDDGDGGAGGASSSAVDASSTASTADASSSTGTSGGPLAVEWSKCPLSSDATTGEGAECSTTMIPLDWSDPSKGTIPFFVKRIPAEMQPSRGQLWFLNGGPGYSGADFENFAKAKTIDLYLPDHRGTGRSERLGCVTAEASGSPGGTQITDEELPGCVETLKNGWGDKLASFTVTNAARDVGEFIRATRRDGDEIIVYGGSYGSVWANRVMQIYEGEQSGVILDAVANDGDLDRIDEWFDGLGHTWMDRCGADAFCSGKLGADPWARMSEVLDGFDAGACPAVAAMGFDRRLFHAFWSYFFYSWDLRTLVAPMVYRLGRCDATDVAFYENFAQAISTPGPQPASQRFFSLLLSAHISMSELWSTSAPTLASLEAFRDTANVTHGLATQFASVYDIWPRYTPDAYDGKLADTDVPILMMHGELDFIPRSVVDPVVAHFSKPGQAFIEVPRAPHGDSQSPSVSGMGTCGSRYLSAFFQNPASPAAVDCEVIPLDFAGNANAASAFFGTADPWEGAASLAKPASSPDVDRALAHLRATWRARHQEL